MTPTQLDQIWACRIPRATDKLVLVMMAMKADEDGRTSLTVAELMRVTCLDRKTVLVAIYRLRCAGWLTDTGGRRGRTGVIPIYMINIKPAPSEDGGCSADALHQAPASFSIN